MYQYLNIFRNMSYADPENQLKLEVAKYIKLDKFESTKNCIRIDQTIECIRSTAITARVKRQAALENEFNVCDT